MTAINCQQTRIETTHRILNGDLNEHVDAVGGRFDVLAVVHATCLLVLFVNHYWCNDGFLLHYGANDFST